ncbi:MAG: hypothetical protein Athens101428_209 [Candidatus Berkelbacteria bacterium Athens1014_28]|uniref:ASCH domain-containing protein n=1 Tax=Candidatus Berkelbacteria bacterium Athens1014_28 TaxID=2017145 RepID=A0A554LPI7_9BACT|nr:MAG: hypothetical protein Athens101428_209 [Candidatus Berkelbacteria bacterium Athens1014_28]
MRRHIAIFVGNATQKILAGEKTMESRFSLHKVLPYSEVAKDDIIFLKKSGGDIVGQAVVDNVLYYDNLKPQTVEILKKEYDKELATSEEYWQKKAKSRFATLIFLKKPEKFLSPMKYKKKDRRPWVVIK